MVLNTLIHHGEKLRCGVEIVGITNFVTFLTNTESYRRDLRRQVYGDERNPEMRDFLTSISPLTNCHKITKPLLVGQGLNGEPPRSFLALATRRPLISCCCCFVFFRM